MVLIRGGIVVDGTGRKPRRADVKVANGTIVMVGDARRESADIVIDADGKAVTPGFIDTHSHAERVLEGPDAQTQIRQGITTAIVGQDGGSNFPVDEWVRKIEQAQIPINIASFVGHGTLRTRILGEDANRPATADEIRRMRPLVAEAMKAGAVGLSTGLEYNPGAYSTTDEIIELAKVAALYNGIYISHVRDEEEGALDSFRELIQIGDQAHIPAQISHIKLASAPVWGKTGEVFRMMDDARRRGVEITADVYPYTYWQSNIITMMPPKTEVRGNRIGWDKALSEIGGPQNVLLPDYAEEPTWQGKTLAEIAASKGKSGVDIILDIMERTNGKGTTAVVTAMRERDVKAFIGHPRIMFCTDGTRTHPRIAGSYPRILGKYVREERVISLEEAIRKATSLPAWRMGFADRGVLAPGKKADIVLFDPKTVHDTATTKDPRSAPVGLTDVLVNGVPVLRDGKMTGEHPGAVLRRAVR